MKHPRPPMTLERAAYVLAMAVMQSELYAKADGELWNAVHTAIDGYHFPENEKITTPREES